MKIIRNRAGIFITQSIAAYALATRHRQYEDLVPPICYYRINIYDDQRDPLAVGGSEAILQINDNQCWLDIKIVNLLIHILFP